MMLDGPPVQAGLSAKMLRRRKAQAEQSAAMRARVFRAAVKCLQKQGYSATTTLLVQKEAKISRGAMLHHFPTRTDLMLFVVRTAFDDGVEMHRQCLEVTANAERDLPDVAWKAASGSIGIAALEILMGARSDPHLARKLKSLFGEIEREEFQLSASLDNSGGKLLSLTSVRTFYWALRGLTIANLVTEDPSEVVKCFEFLKLVFLTYRDIERRKIQNSVSS